VGLAGPAGPTIVLPHGTAVTYSPSGRRLLERDRHGHELARLAWGPDGALAEASLRVPDGSWLTIEPRAAGHAPWGLADRLWRGHEALALFTAVDYARVGFIPALDEPARLPPGGGTAVLNLIASLAADQRCPRLSYRGPFASEELFLALLESFRYEPGAGDPLTAFMEAELAWIPAPHERLVGPRGTWIQMREGIEKVVWSGRAYYRGAWQGIRRHAPRCLREAEGYVLCSLQALGTTIEDHLRIDAAGDTVDVLPVAPPAPGTRPAPTAILRGVAAAVAARSAPVLGPFIREVAAELVLEWGAVARDLIALEGTRLRVATALLPAVRARLAAAATPDERIQGGLAVISELAHLTGDGLRARAQERVAALPPGRQAAVLEAGQSFPAGEAARAIAAAVQALLAEARLGDGMQDERDVEGDEGADR
jgi:hypothetical protein